jgi:hypothetical protein
MSIVALATQILANSIPSLAEVREPRHDPVEQGLGFLILFRRDGLTNPPDLLFDPDTDTDSDSDFIRFPLSFSFRLHFLLLFPWTCFPASGMLPLQTRIQPNEG